jgi:pimeloyl-ACP methyl ester carboxylesterase
MIAQQLAFEYPDMIRRMIVLGTGPRGGEGMDETKRAAHRFSAIRVRSLNDPRPGSLPTVPPLNLEPLRLLNQQLKRC